jgi:hypothetical protein
MNRSTLLACVFLVFFAIAGCGDSGPALEKVQGKILYQDGSPVTSGVVEFEPTTGGLTARSKIEADGRYLLKTGERTGVVAGKHRISIVQMIMAEGMGKHGVEHQKPKVVPPRYAKFDTSLLERTIEAGPKQDVDIEVAEK